MANLTAIFEANVLYPAPLRDLLLWLATTGMFRVALFPGTLARH